MASIKTMIPLLFLFTLGSHVQVLAVAPGCSLEDKVTVYINDLLPMDAIPMNLSCKSKDVDLGNHTLVTTYQDFHWSFCKNKNPPLFVCTLSWGIWSVSFHAFDLDVSAKCKTGQCHWVAKTDGIYFCDSNSLKPLVKVYNWGK